MLVSSESLRGQVGESARLSLHFDPPSQVWVNIQRLSNRPTNLEYRESPLGCPVFRRESRPRPSDLRFEGATKATKPSRYAKQRSKNKLRNLGTRSRLCTKWISVSGAKAELEQAYRHAGRSRTHRSLTVNNMMRSWGDVHRCLVDEQVCVDKKWEQQGAEPTNVRTKTHVPIPTQGALPNSHNMSQSWTDCCVSGYLAASKELKASRDSQSSSEQLMHYASEDRNRQSKVLECAAGYRTVLK